MNHSGLYLLKPRFYPEPSTLYTSETIVIIMATETEIIKFKCKVGSNSLWIPLEHRKELHRGDPVEVTVRKLK